MSMIMTNLTTNNSKDNLLNHIHVVSVEDHSYWKPLLLESINSMITKNNIQVNEKGYYYDFNIPKVHRDYGKLMDNILLSYVEDTLCDNYGLKREGTNTYWFQQYFQGSDFGWHQHSGHWAMVYYVELPEMTEATEFLNYGQFNVKEGDIIFFPTFLVHRSPSIKSNQRKTVIASNLDFTVDRERINYYGIEYFKH